MKIIKISRLVVVLVMLMNAVPVLSQDKLQQSAGGYHGELDFPWSWKDITRIRNGPR
jgi:hypothetical protein